MRNIKPTLKNLFILVILTTVFVACDKDFISLESDISGESNFGVSDNKYEVIAYNNKLGPVQTNGLPSNLLGVYKDFIYGNTTASLVTQLSPTVMDPKFPAETTLDSVVLTIPYFSHSTGIENGKTSYKLDSVFGTSPIKFKVYENTYFLRGFDPSSGFDTPQKYYSDRSLSASSQIPLASLQGTELLSDSEFKPSNKEIKLKKGEDSTLLAPAMRFKMDTNFWNNKIILKGGSAELSNMNNFQNYFRGVYFEAETIANDGSMMLLNFGASNANITLYYSSPGAAADDERIQGSYVMNFSGNRINFFDNDFHLPIPDGDPTTGDEKLYLKGGQGSMAVINLFGGTDIDNDEATITEFEAFKKAYVETDAAGKFVKAKRLVNEANLVFWVDQELTQGQEPDRIYIYDAKNKIPLIDYTIDALNNIDLLSHLGKLQRVSSEKNAKGVKYKIRITEHIKNLLLKDSTNVSLGVAVSINVNAEAVVESQTVIPMPQKSVLSSDNSPVKTVPVSSVISPKGTVLYGNKAVGENKKLYLEIFYTEPNN